MGKKSIVNQVAIRSSNQQQILEIMRFGSHSCTALAKKTGLSNTAVKNIVSELIDLRMLTLSSEIDETESGGLGRKPINYQLNGDLGIVVSINLTDRDLLVCVSKVNRQIIFRKEIKDVIIITRAVLESLCDAIREGLNEERAKGKPLLCISIAAPGLFNARTGEYFLAPRIENCQKVNLIRFFGREFNTDVLLVKDIQAGLIGEQLYGVLSTLRPKNAVFIHFDVNIGLAFLFNGQYYEGERGFAGEFGFFTPNQDAPDKGMGFSASLTAIYIMLKNKIAKEGLTGHPLAGKDVLDFDEVKLLFLSGDETVQNAVKQAAYSLAVQILNMSYMFDVQCFIIDGRVVEFGGKFLDFVNHYIKKHNQMIGSLSVGYSALMNRAITLGSISVAVDFGLNKILNKVAE